MNSLVSVIIPVYNHAHTLERCLGTLVWQAHKQPLEVIIVNDGSTDNFEEALNNILCKYPDIKALNPKIINQKNSGAAAARNRGFKEARGEYIIFVDADTILYPDMIKKMRLALETHAQSSYAYSQFKFGWKKMKSQPFNAADLKKINYIDTTSLIRREALSSPPYQGGVGLAAGGGLPEKGPFDESLKRFHDWDLWLTLLKQNKTGTFVPEVLFKKIVRGRKGMSFWLPQFMYQFWYKISQVQEYEKAKEVVLRKHYL